MEILLGIVIGIISSLCGASMPGCSRKATYTGKQDHQSAHAPLAVNFRSKRRVRELAASIAHADLSKVSRLRIFDCSRSCRSGASGDHLVRRPITKRKGTDEQGRALRCQMRRTAPFTGWLRRYNWC